MSVTVGFQPSPLGPFQFQAVMDGTIYNCVVTWALTGARWWLTINNQDNTPVVALPLTASPPNYSFSLSAGYFSTPLVFLEATQTFVIG